MNIKEEKNQSLTELEYIDYREAAKAIGEQDPGDIGLIVADLAIDQDFAWDRIQNEAEIARLRLRLENLKVLRFMGASNERAAEHEEIVAEMLRLEIENIINSFGFHDVIEELAQQIVDETCGEEDDKETIAEFITSVETARKGISRLDLDGS
jgi:hypothetical protein